MGPTDLHLELQRIMGKYNSNPRVQLAGLSALSSIDSLAASGHSPTKIAKIRPVSPGGSAAFDDDGAQHEHAEASEGAAVAVGVGVADGPSSVIGDGGGAHAVTGNPLLHRIRAGSESGAV
jgi:hypothetical protein